jgi:hypothetical protein
MSPLGYNVSTRILFGAPYDEWVRRVLLLFGRLRMGKLISHEEGKGVARVDLESGDPIRIGVTRTGVTVTRSRSAFFGRTIYSESRLGSVAAHCRHLDALQLPRAEGVPEPVLASFTAAALSARTLQALHALLSVPELIESSYMAEREFAVIQSFVNDYGAFVERGSKWVFGYSEALLPLPPDTLGQILLVFGRAVQTREALNSDGGYAIRFGYGYLALALPSAEGAEVAAIAERLSARDQTVEYDPRWNRVRGRIRQVLESQTAREFDFDRRLPE